MRHLLLLFKSNVHELEYDARAQYRFHLFWAWFWFLQIPAVLVMIKVWPHAWAIIAIIYLTIASLWANFATHFGAMSAALAARDNNEKPKPIAEIEKEIVKDVASGLIE